MFTPGTLYSGKIPGLPSDVTDVTDLTLWELVTPVVAEHEAIVPSGIPNFPFEAGDGPYGVVGNEVPPNYINGPNFSIQTTSDWFDGIFNSKTVEFWAYLTTTEERISAVSMQLTPRTPPNIYSDSTIRTPGLFSFQVAFDSGLAGKTIGWGATVSNSGATDLTDPQQTEIHYIGYRVL